jgi:hypothetical protein
LMLIGSLPYHGYSSQWGYGPAGGLGFLVLVIFLLLVFGRL